MVPVQLTLRNFLSYGDEAQTLDFTGFHVACLTGDNGHGKSALLDAITYALWGQARKERHDRKADDGLLRLGAHELRVEFVFDLERDRYRVIRSYRRRHNTPVVELDLQIATVDGDFHPITDGGSVTRTQQQLERLLRMDYRTFSHSAFLLQGRAAAFTHTGPRERKELLGAILGLDRYGRLSELARTRQLQHQDELASMDRQIAEIKAQLVDLPGFERDLAKVEDQIAHADSRLAEMSAELTVARGFQGRAESARLQRDGLRDRLAAFQNHVAALRRERDRVDAQITADGEFLQDPGAIEAAEAEREQLLAEQQTQVRLLDQLRQLELEAADHRATIVEIQRSVEREHASIQTRRQMLIERLDDVGLLLNSAPQIQARLQRLEETRQRLSDAEAKRADWQDLHGQVDRLRQEINDRASRLEEQVEACRCRLEEVRARVHCSEQAIADLEQMERDLEAANVSVTEAQKLREEMTRTSATSSRERALARALSRSMQEAAQRVSQLNMDEAECPLCGSDLDSQHRSQLRLELEQRRQAMQAEIAAHDTEATTHETVNADACQHLRELGAVEDQRDLLRERLADLQALARRTAEDRVERDQLQNECGKLARRLERCVYAHSERAELVEAIKTLNGLDYRPEQVSELENSVADLAGAETENTTLLQARREHQQLVALRVEVEREEVSVAGCLKEKSFCVEAQAALRQCEQAIADLEYDSSAHEALSARLAELAEAPQRSAALATAIAREAEHAKLLGRIELELASQAARIAALEPQLSDLEAELDSLSSPEAETETLIAKCAVIGAERDELLQQRGSLRAQVELGVRLKKKHRQLCSGRRHCEQEAWIHGQLCEAFGKDGIQALMIESAIPEIEDEANRILARLTDNRIRVVLESIRDLKGGGHRETLDVKIADELGERAYNLYSGGEAFRTDFALRVALSKILARRGGTRLRTLIVDEGFGTQDAEGLDTLCEAIQGISEDFDKVLVVTHLEQLKNAFPVQIEVTKHPETGSRFRIQHLA
ncbi:MAG: SMC family ATPase [Candidatus Latescibacterota bacterium]|nr:SMC family ATPase [Candidatus Latescibacterota bacterium]